MTPEFKAWPKIPRFNRDVTITEKIDGTNACVIVHEGEVYAQSRKRIITPEVDNFGFAAWVRDHRDELLELGEGYHYGEWWGRGIQRGYGLEDRRFSLFTHDGPECCGRVPILATLKVPHTPAITAVLEQLLLNGSQAAPGFMDPEGVIVFHHASRQVYKILLKNDEQPKSITA